MKGNTVVWSCGLVNNFDGLDNGRKTIACYTMNNPIQQALWCTFYCERPNFEDTSDTARFDVDQQSGNPVEAICITDSQTIRVFTPKGEDFTISIPFYISKIWNTKFGIFIEKDDECEY